jgi:hypothetical protein
MPKLPTSLLNRENLRLFLLLIANNTTPTLSNRTIHTCEQWAVAANLLEGKRLTPEGSLMVKRDPYLETTVTAWVLHFHLSHQYVIWKYLVYEFLSNQITFTLDEVVSICSEAFEEEKSENLKKVIRLILRNYTDPQSIHKSKFIVQNKKGYSKGNPDLLNPFTIGYLFAKTWERNFKPKNAILVSEVTASQTGLANILGINEERLKQQFDILAKHEIIEQRSAKPHLSSTKPPIKTATEINYQIIRCWDDPIELLEEAYDNDVATPNQPLIRSLGGVLDDVEAPDLSQFFEWTSELFAAAGGSNTIINFAS